MSRKGNQFRVYHRLRVSVSNVLCAALLALTLAAPLTLEPDRARAENSVADARLDANGDGIVSTVDVSTIVMQWTSAAERQSACDTTASRYDVTGDGCLTIADVQAVSANIGLVSATGSPRVTASSALLGSAATHAVLTITTVADGDDTAPGDGACATADGVCTLRAALSEANTLAGANTIGFDIPGPGPHVIKVTTELPVLSDETGPTTIDGYTQPGAQPNTAVAVSNAIIKIQIDGPREVNKRISINGLQISSPGNVVRGLSLQRFKRPIWISGARADDNVIIGNFIGPSATGQPWYEAIDAVERLGGDPGSFGVWISYAGKRNRIGGSSPADRNVISGNANDGVGMRNEGTESNLIIGNLIGLGPSGETRMRNYGDGIDMNYGAAYNRIGGLVGRERNVISGNLGEGIEISHSPGTAYNQVINNHIGTTVDGKSGSSTIHRNTGFAISLEDGVARNEIGPFNVLSNNGKGGMEIYGQGNVENRIFQNWIGLGRDGSVLPNNGWGIRIRYHATDQTIGPDNRIANHPGPAVLIIDSDVDRNTVTQNRTFANAGLGIDIDPEGVNLNDQYVHSGANERQNFPVIASASRTQVVGQACAGCTVEVFEADSPAGSYGEGRLYVGTGVADGAGAFSITVLPVNVGKAVTSTATSPDGNTSEFSLNVAVVDAPPPGGAIAVPGIIEAEDYRDGGQRIGYSDSTPGNAGGQYRSDDVDLFTCQDPTSGPECVAVGRVTRGEWLRYWIESDSAQSLTFSFRVANGFDGRQLRLELNGIVVSGTVAVPNTGDKNTWMTVSSAPVAVPAGTHQLRVFFEGSSTWLNYVEAFSDS